MPPRFTLDLPSTPAQPAQPQPLPQPQAAPRSSVPPVANSWSPKPAAAPIRTPRPKSTLPALPKLPVLPTFGAIPSTTPVQPIANRNVSGTNAIPGTAPIIPGAPPVFGAPAAYARMPSGTLQSTPSIVFPAPQRVLRPRTRPADVAAKKSIFAKLNKKLTLIIAGALILVSGVGGYFFWFGPANEPRAVFASALSNAMDVKYYRQTFTLDRKIGNSAIRAVYTTDVDATNADVPKASGTMEISQLANDVVSNRKGEFVLMSSDKQYIKLDEFTDENVSGTKKGIDQAGQTLLAEVKGKWLITNEGSSDLPLSTLILLNPLQLATMGSVNGILLFGNIDDAKQKALINFNNAQGVYSIASAKTMSFQGHEAYRYDVNVKKEKLQEYNQLFNSQVLNSSILTSVDGFAFYVDKLTKLPMRMEIDQDDLTIVVDYTNYGKSLTINTPDGAKKIDDVVPGATGDGSGGSLELQGTSAQ